MKEKTRETLITIAGFLSVLAILSGIGMLCGIRYNCDFLIVVSTWTFIVTFPTSMLLALGIIPPGHCSSL